MKRFLLYIAITICQLSLTVEAQAADKQAKDTTTLYSHYDLPVISDSRSTGSRQTGEGHDCRPTLHRVPTTVYRRR